MWYLCTELARMLIPNAWFPVHCSLSPLASPSVSRRLPELRTVWRSKPRPCTWFKCHISLQTNTSLIVMNSQSTSDDSPWESYRSVECGWRAWKAWDTSGIQRMDSSLLIRKGEGYVHWDLDLNWKLFCGQWKGWRRRTAVPMFRG